VNFKNLKTLNLYKSNITDINILAEVNFEKLEVLDLSWNNISNIDFL